MVPVKTISNGLNSPFATAASTTGDIYVDNGNTNHRVDMWSWNATSSVAIMNVTSRCHSLFLDINNTLYCCTDVGHKVVKMSLNSGSNTATIAAGTGTSGSQAYMLSYPNGIFVDKNFNLYVADYQNNRVQMFQPGQLNATTVAGNGSSPSIQLYWPTAIVLDADEYLFISDSANNRIVRSGPYGFQCLLGCSGASGSASNQLNRPYALRFDSYGNLFVADSGNNRIQKFLLMTNSCGKYLISSYQTDLLEKLVKAKLVSFFRIYCPFR
jgi:sugar lactone lactonase YvrE